MTDSSHTSKPSAFNAYEEYEVTAGSGPTVRSDESQTVVASIVSQNEPTNAYKDDFIVYLAGGTGANKDPLISESYVSTISRVGCPTTKLDGYKTHVYTPFGDYDEIPPTEIPVSTVHLGSLLPVIMVKEGLTTTYGLPSRVVSLKVAAGTMSRVSYTPHPERFHYQFRLFDGSFLTLPHKAVEDQMLKDAVFFHFEFEDKMISKSAMRIDATVTEILSSLALKRDQTYHEGIAYAWTAYVLKEKAMLYFSSPPRWFPNNEPHPEISSVLNESDVAFLRDLQTQFYTQAIFEPPLFSVTRAQIVREYANRAIELTSAFPEDSDESDDLENLYQHVMRATDQQLEDVYDSVLPVLQQTLWNSSFPELTMACIKATSIIEDVKNMSISQSMIEQNERDVDINVDGKIYRVRVMDHEKIVPPHPGCRMTFVNESRDLAELLSVTADLPGEDYVYPHYVDFEITFRHMEVLTGRKNVTSSPFEQMCIQSVTTASFYGFLYFSESGRYDHLINNQIVSEFFFSGLKPDSGRWCINDQSLFIPKMRNSRDRAVLQLPLGRVPAFYASDTYYPSYEKGIKRSGTCYAGPDRILSTVQRSDLATQAQPINWYAFVGGQTADLTVKIRLKDGDWTGLFCLTNGVHRKPFNQYEMKEWKDALFRTPPPTKKTSVGGSTNSAFSQEDGLLHSPSKNKVKPKGSPPQISEGRGSSNPGPNRPPAAVADSNPRPTDTSADHAARIQIAIVPGDWNSPALSSLSNRAKNRICSRIRDYQKDKVLHRTISGIHQDWLTSELPSFTYLNVNETPVGFEVPIEFITDDNGFISRRFYDLQMKARRKATYAQKGGKR